MAKTNFAFAAFLVLGAGVSTSGAAWAAPFKIFMISSTASDHLASSAAARTELPKMGMTNDFTVDATTDNTLINDANLARYDVFLSMHLAPFEIKAEQRGALENFVKSGKGWVGVHAAGLIIPGEYQARGAPETWEFYDNLMGGVHYVTHPMLQMGTVIVEDRTHPATRNMPAMFQIVDEWYEFSGNPRGKVRILGKADERTYRQVRPMGDHPLIWTCEMYPRAIYIGTGHDASDWQNTTWTALVRDSLLWAAGRLGEPGDGGVDGPAPADAAAPDAAADAGGSGGASGSGGAAPDAAAGSGGAGGSTGTGGAAPTTGSGGASGSGGAPAASSGGSGCLISGTDGNEDFGNLAPWLVAGLVMLAFRRRRA